MNDDCELVRRIVAGDSAGLRDLYQRHGRALLRFSTAMCRSRQSAEDLVHDTFVAFLREPSLFDPAQGTVLGYLCGVLRHQISRHSLAPAILSAAAGAGAAVGVPMGRTASLMPAPSHGGCADQ